MDDWDPLHDPGTAHLHWSTDNVGEAAPGVLTPLSATVWQPVGASMPRNIAYAMGAFTRAERRPPPDDDLVVRLFYGRLAIQLEYLATVGDRLPGTTGAEAVAGLLGKVPDDIAFSPTRRRYPIVAWRLPVAFATIPGRVRRNARETDGWWRAQIPRLDRLDLRAATETFAEAAGRFERVITVHSLGLLGSVQPLYQALCDLVERAGVGDPGVLSGTGGAEMAIVEDIWKASRGWIGIEDVISNHGFHGPLEGELAGRVWREDPEPLRRVMKEYVARPESEDPTRRETEGRARAEEMRRAVIAGVPRAKRPGARLLLRLAAERIPLRGVGKRSFLQALDVARGAARRAGEHLAAEGRLDDADDVFYLTFEELTGVLPPDAKELVAKRRRRRAEYEQLTIPASWKGTPVPVSIGDDLGDDSDEESPFVDGIGVSSGVAEGPVRVVSDPSFADVEPDEILVARTTDPSWCSIMFVSSALVMDIGGQMSHAAVVARELGLPCVVNTRTGTRRLRTGDRVRVDGSAGTVEILERAPEVVGAEATA